MRNKIIATTLLTLVFASSSASFTLASSNEIPTGGQPIFPVEDFNKIAKQKGKAPVSKMDIPTKEQLNQALSKVQVSKDHPKEVIDLGNGHQIVVQVGERTQVPVRNYSYIAPDASEYISAYGEVFYTFLGVKVVSLSVTENYTRDTLSSKILTFSTPSAAAPAHWWGWSGALDGAPYIYKIDSYVIDAIANGKYTPSVGGTVFGHIELRCTGAGNYYVQNAYFQ